MSLTNISRYISLILRHKPETIGITLDKHGWANVNDLIEGVSQTYPISMEVLEEIVRTDDKQRYSFNSDKTLIRANQGHSINVDVQLKESIPPDMLYHGTGEKYVSSIEESGLISKSRLYVHLSSDYDTAIKVGLRHGKPVVYFINCKDMIKDGYKFYLSVNGVWLTKHVPIKYIKMITKKDYSKYVKGDEVMNIHVRLASKEDLNSIIEIEQVCFPKAEAGSAALFKERYHAFPEWFFVAEYNNQIIGFIDGATTDAPSFTDELYFDASLHQPNGAYQTVFSLAVLPDYQKHGVGEKLMRHFVECTRQRGKKGIVLTCKDRLIHYYQKFGYQHIGVSASSLGDAKWNDMLLLFDAS